MPVDVVSSLRRVTGGDAKAAPTVDDKVLLVDSADVERVKMARVGDLPSPPPISPYMPPPEVFWHVLLAIGVPDYGVDEFGTLRLAFSNPGPHKTVGYYLQGGGNPELPCPVRIPPQLRDVILVNATNRSITVSPGIGPGPLMDPNFNPRTFRLATADPQSPDETSYELGALSSIRLISTDDGEARLIIFRLNNP